MRIAGYAHKENAFSNVLAFFLDPNKPHGLGTLFLNALARTGKFQHHREWTDSNVSVEREVPTDAGNQIDILIQSDSHVILIENKIYARVANPLDDYKTFAYDLKPRCRNIRLLLLTLNSTTAGSPHRFENITHQQFVAQIRVLLGRFITSADARYLPFMLDFLSTVDYLQRGMVMDSEFRQLVGGRLDDVSAFLTRCGALRTELCEKVNALREELGPGPPNVSQHLRRPDLGNKDVPCSLVDELVHRIRRQDFQVNVRTVVSPAGWEFRIGHSGDKAAELQGLLEELNIRADPEPERVSLLFHQRFGYGEELDRVAETVRSLVHRLAGGAG